jgi:hypothetical protein
MYCNLLLLSALPSTGISVAVTTTDNCVHVINTATMREDWTVRSLCITSRTVSVPKRKEVKQLAAADSTEDITTKEVQDFQEDEHQFLGVNRAAISRSQAHTLPFIQSDRHWRSTLAGTICPARFLQTFQLRSVGFCLWSASDGVCWLSEPGTDLCAHIFYFLRSGAPLAVAGV